MLSFVVLAAATLASAQPAAAPESPPPAVRFVGETTGTEAAGVRDQALAELLRFAGHALHCGAVHEIRVTAHPNGWVPADANFRMGPAGSTYERWDASMCDRTEPFLIVFWREGNRTEFQVGHPHPSDRANGAP